MTPLTTATKAASLRSTAVGSHRETLCLSLRTGPGSGRWTEGARKLLPHCDPCPGPGPEGDVVQSGSEIGSAPNRAGICSGGSVHLLQGSVLLLELTACPAPRAPRGLPCCIAREQHTPPSTRGRSAGGTRRTKLRTGRWAGPAPPGGKLRSSREQGPIASALTGQTHAPQPRGCRSCAGAETGPPPSHSGRGVPGPGV